MLHKMPMRIFLLLVLLFAPPCMADPTIEVEWRSKCYELAQKSLESDYQSAASDYSRHLKRVAEDYDIDLKNIGDTGKLWLFFAPLSMIIMLLISWFARADTCFGNGDHSAYLPFPVIMIVLVGILGAVFFTLLCFRWHQERSAFDLYTSNTEKLTVEYRKELSKADARYHAERADIDAGRPAESKPLEVSRPYYEIIESRYFSSPPYFPALFSFSFFWGWWPIVVIYRLKGWKVTTRKPSWGQLVAIVPLALIVLALVVILYQPPKPQHLAPLDRQLPPAAAVIER